MHSAFFQMKLQEKDCHKLAFTTVFGRYEPLRLPFGSKNSSTYFALLIKKCLEPLEHLHIKHFLDDIIIPANSFEEMHAKIGQLLDRLIEFNLTLDPKKTQLFKSNINFLGYNINQHGCTPSEQNIEKIKKFPKPKTAKQVKSFLGLTNYFRILINNYAELTLPLVELTKKSRNFKWTEKEDDAFMEIQNIILKQPQIYPLDKNKTFYVFCDAAKIALSGILAQRDKHNNMRPIEFFSRKLKTSETNYPSIKRELLAIHDTILHFKNYLYGKKFVLMTDAKPLTHHLDLTNQSELTQRWMIDLQQYEFSTEHIKGEENPADYLSRTIFHITVKEKLLMDLFKTDEKLSLQNIATEQQNDPNLKPIIERIKHDKTIKTDKKFYIDKKNFNVLYIKHNFTHRHQDRDNKQKIMLPKSLILNVLKNAHKAHFGPEKTFNIINKHYFWYGAKADTTQFCKLCTKCNLFKTHPTIKTPLQKVEKNFQIGEHLAIDIIGPYPSSIYGKNYALTIIDTFSRYLEIFPLKTINSQAVMRALNEYFARFGLPKFIQTDNGTQFTSKEFENFLKILGIEHRKTSIYMPRSNGLIERSHRTLKESISAMCTDVFEWDIQLLYFKLAYNNSKHRATGFSPAFLFFNRNLRTPFNKYFTLSKPMEYSDFLKSQIKHIQKIRLTALSNMEKLMAQYTKKLDNKNVNINIGDHVFLKKLIPSTALKEKFSGPYSVIAIFRNKNILIKSVQMPFNKPIKVHISKVFTIPNQLKTNLQNTELKKDEINKQTAEHQQNSKMSAVKDKNNEKQSTARYNLRSRNK